jgi:hypothetical protein
MIVADIFKDTSNQQSIAHFLQCRNTREIDIYAVTGEASEYASARVS